MLASVLQTKLMMTKTKEFYLKRLEQVFSIINQNKAASHDHLSRMVFEKINHFSVTY